jgi:hypothetical protein
MVAFFLDDMIMEMRKSKTAAALANTSSSSSVSSGASRWDSTYSTASSISGLSNSSSSGHGGMMNADDKDFYSVAVGTDKLSLIRASSKEIGDRISDRYPVPPANIDQRDLVENMVRSFTHVALYLFTRFIYMMEDGL